MEKFIARTEQDRMQLLILETLQDMLKIMKDLEKKPEVKEMKIELVKEEVPVQIEKEVKKPQAKKVK